MEKRITRASNKKTERLSCSVSGSLTESHSITATIPTIPTLESLISVCEERIKQRHLSRPKRKRSILTEDTIDKLVLIIDELKELNDIVGLHEVKNTIVEHVLYLAQNLSSDDDMNHIQIVGEPGVGKTTLAYLLGRIYAALGFLENGDAQLYFSGSFDVATGPRGIRTKFVPGASGRGWPRFRIECSFRTITKFPLTSSDYVRPRGSTKVGSKFVLGWTFSG